MNHSTLNAAIARRAGQIRTLPGRESRQQGGLTNAVAVFSSSDEAGDLASRFFAHAHAGLWKFIPVNEALLRRTGIFMISAPREIFPRTADAVHLATAKELGERDVWTNDRHVIAAAPYFGLTGRSV